MNLHKIINRIKEKKASKRFDVEIPEFNVKDCLKEEGIKIRVKNSEEKYLDVIFKVSTKFSSDPDGYGEDLESFAASFSYTAKMDTLSRKRLILLKKIKKITDLIVIYRPIKSNAYYRKWREMIELQ